MSDKQARGTKRSCQSCNNRFYDLNHDPIVCPLCSTPFVLTAVEVAAIAAEAAAKPKMAKPALKEKVFALPDTPVDGEELPDMESTEALAEIEGEEAEIADDETADDTFLEPEEGEESDVAGLIDSPVEGEEET
jgi:uncharacterized protein (TIGR02300 family)